jgi:hypothetical protein
MKLTASLLLSLVWVTASAARAEEHRGEHHDEHHAEPHEEHHAEQHHDEHRPDARDQRPEWHGGPPPQVRNMERRGEPPRWQPHPPGAHPHGPVARQHGVRVLRPVNVRYGARQWRHWEHPAFARPVYYWDWYNVRQVTCVAEDSYGDQYPVTEDAWRGFGLNNMSDVEDDALDRCYQESGGDPSCYLATCSHY